MKRETSLFIHMNSSHGESLTQTCDMSNKLINDLKQHDMVFNNNYTTS